MNEMGTTIQIEKAKADLRAAVNRIADQYDLSVSVMCLLLRGVIAEEAESQLTMLCSEINIKQDEPAEAVEEEKR